MCGIIANIQHDQLIPQEQFQQQLDSIRHRGPDDQGVWFSPNGHVGLGTRRLAIQDLSPAGHMPMGDPSGQVWITYNGEIYNFQPLRADLTERGYAFRSGSDTEVVLAAYLEWGTDCLDFLNGMYAFVIYDSRDIPQSPHLAGPGIFAARDRAGEKPFYYWPHADGIYCASELKSLIANPNFPRRLDTAALNFYLAYGYVPGNLCILDEVKKLPAAHALTYVFETKALKTWRYWQPPTNMPVETADPDTLVNELESLLEDSVRARLVADVPVGILLSGGLDSSLITAMAARTSSTPVKTFTISFPGHGHYDEGPFARQVADYFATDHCELIAEPATIDLLPEMAHYFDEPLGDSSLIPTYLVSRLTREHVTVALGGDGGDELFGGYRRYSNALNKQRLLTRVPQPVRALTARIASELPTGLKGRRYLGSLGGDLQQVAIHDTLYFDRVARRRLFAKPMNEALKGVHPEAYKIPLQSGIDHVDRMTRSDFFSYLVDDILVKVDRASMAVSLETRAPWLDKAIMEFAFGRVPSNLKATTTERKRLLRLLGQKLLPDSLDLTRKQGFSLPLGSWFKGSWGTALTDMLSDADPALFNQAEITNLVAGQRRGYDNSSRLFALTMFELWRREYQIRL